MYSIEEDLWVDKYSPSKLDDVILDDKYRQKFEEFIEDKKIPHILLQGSPGSGKTLIATILTNNIISNKEDNLLIINGSSQEKKSINFVEDIEDFLKLPPVGVDKIKILFVDEADRMTKDSLDAQRNIIEKYQKNNRYIFTANYLNKFTPAILSRFQHFKFKSLPKDLVIKHCYKVLESENVKYKDNDVNKVIDNIYPDIRRILNTLSSCTINNELIMKSEDDLTSEHTAIKLFLDFIDNRWNNNKSININTIMKSMIEETVNNELDYISIYEKLFFNNKIPIPVKIIINEFSTKNLKSEVPQMNFMAMVFKSAEIIKKYKSMKNG